MAIFERWHLLAQFKLILRLISWSNTPFCQLKTDVGCDWIKDTVMGGGGAALQWAHSGNTTAQTGCTPMSSGCDTTEQLKTYGPMHCSWSDHWHVWALIKFREHYIGQTDCYFRALSVRLSGFSWRCKVHTMDRKELSKEIIFTDTSRHMMASLETIACGLWANIKSK